MNPVFSFPRSHRLLLPADYSGVFKENVRVSDRYWTILAGKGQDAEPRLGMAIAKKRAKRAVDRNRLKRVVREHFRLNNTVLGGIDLVVMNRDMAIKASNEELRESLESLWSKLVVKCKK